MSHPSTDPRQIGVKKLPHIPPDWCHCRRLPWPHYESQHPYIIYLIESSQHWYVGSTTQTLSRRMEGHRSKSGKSPIYPLHVAGVKFEAKILENNVGSHPEVIEAEQYWYLELSRVETRICLNRKNPDGTKVCRPNYAYMEI